METLLSLSFDNISSKDGLKIRKGLRQIEGLLAQICLSTSAHSSPSKRRASVSPESNTSSPKTLGELPDDPAFREFFRLQDGFEYNVASRLVSCLERLLGMGSNDTYDLLISSALTLLHGLLLIHPPSRSLFSREISMNLLLDLLDPEANCPAIQSNTLLVLIVAMLHCPRNARAFETVDGLLAVTSLLKHEWTTNDTRRRVAEFLYFYLLPEKPAAVVKAFGSNGSSSDEDGERNKDTKSTREKQRMLGKYLSNIDEVVQELRETAPFGELVA